MLNNQVNLIITDGGMGDLLGELTAVDWAIRNNPKHAFHVWLPDYLHEFARNVLPRNRCLIRSFKDEALFNKSFHTRTTQWVKYNPTPIRMHAVDYGFITLTDRLPLPHERNYLQITPTCKNLPEKYVCIQAAFAEPCKTMPAPVANEIIKFVVSKGYEPVFIGREEARCGFKDLSVRAKPIEIDYSAGINLLNKTSLLETASWIAGAKCFIGMEGGLTHLAGFTDVDIISAFTLGDPRIHAGPIRKDGTSYKLWPVFPDEHLQNRFYQTHSSCFAEDGQDCRKFPGWEKILASITADKYIQYLETIL